jgi:hypothetical protein
VNIQEYISSGIIETYVMGAATPEEEKQLLAMAEQYPEIQAEIEAVQSTIESYARLHSKVPPQHVKEKLMNAISGQSAADASFSNSTETVKSSLRIDYLRPLTMAASVLLVASAALNIYLYNNLQNSKARLSELENQNRLLTQNEDIQKASYERLVHDLNIMKNPATRAIRMSDPANAEASVAVVYWDTISRQTYISLENMPELPAGKQYQLWAFVAGQPVDMGLFDLKKGVLLEGKKTDKAEKFAVTLEDAGNGPVPKGKLMVIGSI